MFSYNERPIAWMGILADPVRFRKDLGSFKRVFCPGSEQL